MLRMPLPRRSDAPLTVLCLGAHSDDIEIGCGGTVLRLLDEVPAIKFHWVVLGASGERAREAESSVEQLLGKSHRSTVAINAFRDGFFPYAGAEIKQYFEQLKRDVAPDLILTHFRGDLHQDHRLVSELTWNTFRDHLILEYEIMKYDGDLGAPNFFVPLGEAHCRSKVDHVMRCFASQRGKAWFTEDTFLALLRLRGVECNAPERYAEAFYCRKIVC
jgi:LmbE family N-acetylglucosaminyl deacetylase